MTTLKILRFTGHVTQIEDCWQKSVASFCSLSYFNEDLAYILREIPQRKLRHWVFGFTKDQFVQACKGFKTASKFCTYKDILNWSNQSELKVYRINEKHVFIFEDQVLFDKRKEVKPK